jgi:hypothetical protein
MKALAAWLTRHLASITHAKHTRMGDGRRCVLTFYATRRAAAAAGGWLELEEWLWAAIGTAICYMGAIRSPETGRPHGLPTGLWQRAGVGFCGLGWELGV